VAGIEGTRNCPDEAVPVRLSVCIVTHRRPAGLGRLLGALEPQMRGRTDREIVVVNDGSDGPEYRAVLALTPGCVRYQALPVNRGVSFARHFAAEAARGTWLVFIDDDCLPPPFWLAWLDAVIDTSPELDLVVGAIKPLLPSRAGFFARVQVTHRLHPHPERIGDQMRFVTANLAIRAQAYRALGGFRVRPDYPNASEDTELSSRVSRSACARRIEWDWYVHHDVGDGFRVNLRRYWRYGYANGILHGLTSSPPYHDAHANAAAGRQLRALLVRIVKRRWHEGRRVHRGGVAFASALAACALDIAYLAGLRAALRVRRRV
jgi:mycofactocin glycosyltransferase